MRHFILLFIILPTQIFSQSNLDTQIGDLCNQISLEMSEYKKTTIAVIEFSDLDGNVTDLGKFLSEEVITKLFQTKKFKVIERQLLNKIIKEQKLQVSGIIDEMSAKKLGKLLGVNAIVSGTVAELYNSVKINARLIGTETGEIFGAASVEIPKDESIEKLISVTHAARTEMEQTKGSQTKSSKSTNEKIIETEEEDFLFRVIGCKRKKNQIDCVISFKNTGEKEVKLGIMNTQAYWGHHPSYLYDNFGTQYPVFVQIGTVKGTYHPLEQLFVPDLPIAVHFIAENVNSEATSVSITISAEPFKKTIMLKDIAITN